MAELKQLFNKRLTKDLEGLHAYVKGDWVGLLIPYGITKPFAGMDVFEAEEYAYKRGFVIIFISYREGELESARMSGDFENALEVIL